MFCVFCSFSFSSNAQSVSSTKEFYVPYPEPTVSEYDGYCCVVYQNLGGQYVLNTYFWNIRPSEDADYSIDPVTSMSIIKSGDRITFIATGEGSTSDWIDFNLCEYTSSETLSISRYGGYRQDDARLEYSYDYSPYGSIVGILYKGNVRNVQGCGGYTPPLVHWSDSVDAQELYSYLSRILTKINSIDDHSVDIFNKLVDIYNSNLDISNKLDALKDLYEDMLAEQKETNNWLQKIWNSIREFLDPKDEDVDKTDKFKDDSENQKNEIDDLNEQNKVDKPDADSLSDSVDANINMDDAAEFSGVLSVITNNEYVLQMLLVSLSITVVAYILFGKKD